MMDFENETRGVNQIGTAGAVPILNEKGEYTMQKVKVSRYVAGQRPKYAGHSSDEDTRDITIAAATAEIRSTTDRRLKRLGNYAAAEKDRNERKRVRRREVEDPEIVDISNDEDSAPEPEVNEGHVADVESSDNEELDNEEVERRRQLLRQRVLKRRQEEEIMQVEEEDDGLKDISDGEGVKEESSEYEEYTTSEDSEDGEEALRLKPYFIPKYDRQTLTDKVRENEAAKYQEQEQKRIAKDRRSEALRLIEHIRRSETETKDVITDLVKAIDVLNTDDDNEEVAYEEWKLRELKRIKRDRESREKTEKEREQVERLRNMTEEQRRQFFKNNPKFVTNQAPKGKYKFLQRYYHRGAFYLDEEEDVLKNDYTLPTLEDHFDKTILPKVMQVKNFGRSGRTKYTHLVDQDTTKFDSPWSQDNPLNSKFNVARAGGMKEVYDKPSASKKATTS